MHQLKIGSIPLPKIYICEDHEADLARASGLSYIVKPRGWTEEKLVKHILYRPLMKKFPYIKWQEVLGIKGSSLDVYCEDDFIEHVSSAWRECPGDIGGSDEMMQQSDGYRPSAGGLDPDDKLQSYHRVDLESYFDEHGFQVDVEELQALKVLPTFLDDIATAVHRNMQSVAWADGYNKKLGIPNGRFDQGYDAPNLIILDTSGSIPRGVAATMIALIDTLRCQANADLIITSRRSEFFPANSKLPDVDNLGYMIGGCNECRQFYDILRNKVLGKHWGNVIVFGDNDSPDAERFWKDRDVRLVDNELSSTRIDSLLAFHTYWNSVPGYALWATRACPQVPVTFNTEWTKFMRKDRW